MKKFFLSTILASSLILPASVYAASDTPPPAHTTPAHGHEGPKHDGPMHHKKGEKGPHGNEVSRLEKHQAFMKERFMKLEKAIDLRPDQKPIWNKYVESVMEMMTPSKRPTEGPKHENLLPGEYMADRFLAQKPKADRLKAVAGELRKTLDEGQIKRLREANAEHMKHMRDKKPGPHHPAPDAKKAPAPEKPQP